MFKQNSYKTYISLAIISFLINFYVASHGVFPVDTFIHYDYGYRILLGDNPVTDYWIVHGFIIDYIQAIFFKIFGNNWYSYVIHSSIFNVIITLSSYSIFRLLKVDFKLSFLISIFVAFLAYPVSGTPFLDLHSTFFSLLAVYTLIFAIVKNKNFYWFYASILLGFAFFSKQVPAVYTIIGVSLINIYFTIIKKNIKIFIYFISGATFFLTILFLFLIIRKIPISDFILQIFLFPPSIGVNRYETYDLNFKNIILDYKFIYFVFIPIIIVNLINLRKLKKYYYSTSFEIFLILFIFFCTTLFHQIYTKNQVYIFSLIPIFAGFLIYYKNFYELKFHNLITYTILAFCFFATIKYHIRFNIERKFHELNYTKISDSIDATVINKKFSGLKWITPYFNEPQKEVEIINSFFSVLEKDSQNKMLITEYNFFSSLLNENLHAPSRTYDLISYPRKNTKYFENYKKHLIDIIKKNKIEKVYIFEPSSIYDKNEIIFNYISENCFKKDVSNTHFVILQIADCKELK